MYDYFILHKRLLCWLDSRLHSIAVLCHIPSVVSLLLLGWKKWRSPVLMLLWLGVFVSQMVVLQIPYAKSFDPLPKNPAQHWCAEWRTSGKQDRFSSPSLQASMSPWAGLESLEPLLAPLPTQLGSAEHWRQIWRLIISRQAISRRTTAL